LFQQTTAPTGWTKQTTHNNKALRIVSGTAGSGGTKAFTTTFGSGKTTDAHTLTVAQIPAHTHSNQTYDTIGTGGEYYPGYGTPTQTITSSSTGGGGSHTHNLSNFDLQYVDVIIASKD
jgi:hypothetical protein